MKLPYSLLFLTFVATSCSRHVPPPDEKALIIYVDAKHLDYRSTEGFMVTMLRSGGQVGHAWIALKDGEDVICGGHSGELGITQPRYCEGIQNLLDYGYVCPTADQRRNPRYEPNPIRYLWEVQRDGFFQPGAGIHRPTYAVKIPVDSSTIKKMKRFIKEYPFNEYSIVGNQCTSFCVQLAAIAGIELQDRITLPLSQSVIFMNRRYQLWEDPYYSSITFPSPDVLEMSLKRLRSAQSSSGRRSRHHGQRQ